MIFSSVAICALRFRLRRRARDAGRRRARRGSYGVSNVEVADFLRVLLDKLAPGLDLVAHERPEQQIDIAVAVRAVRAELDLQQRPRLRVHRGLPQLLRVHLGEPLVPLDLERDVLLAQVGGDLVPLEVRVGVVRLFAGLDEVQRRLGDEHLAVFDQRRHVAIQEREEQRSDVGAVHVRVRHEDDPVVAPLVKVEVLVDAGAERGDHRADLLVPQHLVHARLLDVQDLALNGQDRLEVAIAAGLGAAAGRLALDDEDLALGGVLLRAVRELAGERADVERVLAAHEVARLPRRLARPRGLGGLGHDLARIARMRLQELRKPLADDRLHQPLDLGVAELGLRLPLELRVRQLERDHRGQPLAHVLARQRDILEQALPAPVIVDAARQRGSETDEVGAPLGGVDRVDVREHVLQKPGVVLHGRLDLDPVPHAADRDRVTDGLLALVVRLDELRDAAVVLEFPALAGPLVRERQDEAGVEVRQLVEALGEDLGVEHGLYKDVLVRQEPHRRAGAVALAGDAQRAHALAAFEPLFEAFAIPADLDLEPPGQRVDHGDAHAVQTARDLVTAAAELAAGVQHRHHDLDARLTHLRDGVDGNAAAVIADRDAAVGMEHHVDLLCETGERFVDAVVHHLEDQVMETPASGAADVHARTLAYAFEALEDLDLLRVVYRLIRQAADLRPLRRNPNQGMAKCHASGDICPILSTIYTKIIPRQNVAGQLK